MSEGRKPISKGTMGEHKNKSDVSSVQPEKETKLKESIKYMLLKMDGVVPQFEEIGISLDMLEGLSIRKTEGSENTCSLKKRIGLEELVRSTGLKVKKAENAYITEVKSAIRFLSRNLIVCKNMDRILGELQVEEEILDEESNQHHVIGLKSNDGSKMLTCPYSSCNLKTSTLRKHLNSEHSELSADDREYIFKIIRRMASNAEVKDETSTSTETKVSKEESGDKGTDLVIKRQNWRKCVICGALQSNMPSHLTGFHKILKNTDPSAYRSYIRDSKIVPKCYLKRVDGSMVMIEGDELLKVNKEDESLTEKQVLIDVDLKKSRGKREISKKKKAQTKTEDDLIENEYELVTADYESKLPSCKDSRIYSEQLTKWRESFLVYLEKRNNCSNPKQRRNMVSDILFNYEEISGKPITAEDIFDAENVRKMLREFTLIPKIGATKKLKYIGSFNIFVRFLFLDVESSEQVDNKCSTESVSRKIQMKQVQQEIKEIISVLSKVVEINQIRTKNNKEKLVHLQDAPKN